MYLTLPVHDFALAYANEAAMQHFTVMVFIKSIFEIDDLGEISYYFGVQIIRTFKLGITVLLHSSVRRVILIKRY